MLINKKRDMTPFDMNRKPCRQNIFLLPLLWAASYIATRGSCLKITKKGMAGLKPPYLVLSEHQGFMDYYISPLSIFPYRANYISDVEGFAAYGKFLYRQIGCIAKRRFTNDISLIKNITHVVWKNKDILMVYPEARHSNIGTNSKLPLSIGKLIKLLNVPVVVLKTNGSYLTLPIWDEKHKRKVPIYATLEKVLDISSYKTRSAAEITEILDKHFEYDEYKWQYNNGIKITYANRAEGLHKALYMCPSCKTEFKMSSKGKTLTCEKCHKSWQMDEYGRLAASGGTEEFTHIPDWYEFERDEVNKQITNSTYYLSAEVRIEALPNEKGFVDLGNGMLEHTEKGFLLTFFENNDSLYFSSSSMNSVQTEYDYKGRGECIVLSTNDCCYYLYPLVNHCNVTKIQFAAERFYQISCESFVNMV